MTMRHRIHTLAGLFALLATTSAVAESVVASTCAPGMDMAAADVTAGHDGMPAGQDVPTGHEMPSGHEMSQGHDHGPEGDAGERECPFGPIAAVQGCAGVASLPAHVARLEAPSPEGAVAVFTEASQHQRLFGTALFRPPRA